MMFTIDRILLATIALMLSPSGFAQTKPVCPTPPTRVSVRIDADVKYDSVSKIYSYSYTLVNNQKSVLPIDSFYILTKAEPISLKTVPQWISKHESNVSGFPNRIFWTTAFDAVPIGKTSHTFSFTSNAPPGTVTYLTSGDSDIPFTVPDRTSDEPTPNCPGFYFNGAWANQFVTGVTTGPVSSDQVSAILKIGKINEKNHRQSMHVSHKDKSRVKVTVYGSDTLNVADIDISSLKFGPGEAKPLSTKIIPFEDGDEHEKPNESKKSNKQPIMLRLEFSIVDLKLRCNLDHALFLSGKVRAKNLFGGVEVEPDVCSSSDIKKKPKEVKEEKI